GTTSFDMQGWTGEWMSWNVNSVSRPFGRQSTKVFQSFDGTPSVVKTRSRRLGRAASCPLAFRSGIKGPSAAPTPSVCSSFRRDNPTLRLCRILVLLPARGADVAEGVAQRNPREQRPDVAGDRKSTRLNSSHVKISYAVFCLKKKK